MNNAVFLTGLVATGTLFAVASHAVESYDMWFGDAAGAPITSVNVDTGGSVELSMWASSDEAVNMVEARWALKDGLDFPLDRASIVFCQSAGGSSGDLKSKDFSAVTAEEATAGYVHAAGLSWYSSVSARDDPSDNPIYNPGGTPGAKFKVFTFTVTNSSLTAGQSSMISLLAAGGTQDTSMFQHIAYNGGTTDNTYTLFQPSKQYDVRINAIPEPGSLAGMAAAGVGVLVPRLKRRIKHRSG